MNLRNTVRNLLSLYNNAQYWCVFLISLFLFQLWVGFSVVNPNNTNWLLGGDAAANYLGWEFFRDSPMTIFPLGQSPSFGTGCSSSIVFTDSIPLLAIPFKFILFAYHSDFQYFGAWLLCCFLFQGFFACRLVSRVSSSTVLRISGSLLFLLAPIFLYRLTFDGYGHLALAGQFVIIAAIETALSSEFRIYKWFVLLPTSILINFYLFGMVLAIFLFRLIYLLVNTRQLLKNHLKLLLSSAGACLVSIIAFYLAGGFSANGATDSSYGTYRASLTSLVDPQAGPGTKWSKLLGDIPDLPGSSEGFSFLGFAIILLFPFMLFGLIVISKQNRRIVWFMISAVAMGLFALSPAISVANREVFKYPIPRFVEPLFSAFRSSGRFTWPVVYVLILLAVIGIERLRPHFPRVIFVLPLLGIFQIWDSAHATSASRQRFSIPPYETVLIDPNWNITARHYSHLEVIPPLNNDPNWIDFALLAKKWSMTTNAAYVGRSDDAKFSELVQLLQLQASSLKFRSDTLYVLTNYPPNPLRPKLISLIDSPRLKSVRLLILDDFLVIAPRM